MHKTCKFNISLLNFARLITKIQEKYQKSKKKHQKNTEPLKR